MQAADDKLHLEGDQIPSSVTELHQHRSQLRQLMEDSRILS